jgi:hypothetical protein
MSGQYFVEVHTLDGTGGETTVTKQVSVENRNSASGAGVVTAGPNVLKASAGSMVTTFRTNSSLSLTLRVSLYSVAGELLKVLPGNPGTGSVSFDASGLASGTYLAMVQVLDGKGGILSRQTVKIAVIH